MSKMQEPKMAGVGMTSKHRQIIREKYETLIDNLQADQVLVKMKDVFSSFDEEDIKSKPTERKRAEEMLDILPRKGDKAFPKFVEVLSVIQPWLAEHLAILGGISLSPTSPHLGSEKDCLGMDRLHQEVLRTYVEDFKNKLNVDKMVEGLVKEGILHDNIAQQILQLSERSKQAEKLILDYLPKSGPKAFEKFCRCLVKQQPTFAHEWKNKVKESHRNVEIDFGTSYQESNQKASTNSDMNVSHSHSPCTMNLLSPCSQLPEEVKTILKDVLDKPPDELYDNDWKLLYKTLELPEGKENLILNKGGSPTSHVIDGWIRAKGKRANVKCLLAALQICHHGHLVEQFEKILGVEYKEDGQDVIDGIGNMHIETPIPDVPVRIVGNIPPSLRLLFIKQLEALQAECLSEIATNVLEERCYVNTARDFLEKIKKCSMRILFRELKKEGQVGIVSWMRDKLPQGSTGPLKLDDECRANRMSYLSRLEITKELTASNEWKILAARVGLSPTDISLLDGRHKEPAEAVITHWEVRSGTTVGALYDLLVDCRFRTIADTM